MSGGGSQPQTIMMPQQQQTTNQLPQWVQDAGQANYNLATQIGQQQMGQYYTGPRVADMNSGQINAINALNQNVGSTNAGYNNAMGMINNAMSGANPYFSQGNTAAGGVSNAINGLNGQVGNVTSNINLGANPAAGAMGALGQAMNYNPQQVQAQSFPQGDLSAYMNPYTQNVINSSLATMNQQKQQDLNSNASNAMASKAFGGSRDAIQNAVLQSQYGMNAGNLAANLNNQNFNNAQNMMQADMTRNMQGQLANQQAGLTNQGQMINAATNMGNLGLTNQGQNLQAQQYNNQNALANQQNNINALQNAGALGINQANAFGSLGSQYGNLGLNAANQYGNMVGQQQSDYLNQLNAALSGSGMLQQQQQNQLGAAQQAFQDMQNSYINPLNMQISALSNTPYNTSTNSSGFSSQLYQPTSGSPFSNILGGILGGAGMAGKFMSDENEKTNIKKLGKDPITGIPMYAYDYKDDVEEAKEEGKPMPPKRVGPMAQDIEKVAPKKVSKIGNKKVVNLGFGRG